MDESLPDSVIATQAGMLASCFTGAQFLTAMAWGRISDSERGGRKLVILIGLFGTSKFICFWNIILIITDPCNSAFRTWFWLLKDLLASGTIEDNWRGVEWQYWSHENNDLRNCAGKEVYSILLALDSR